MLPSQVQAISCYAIRLVPVVGTKAHSVTSGFFSHVPRPAPLVRALLKPAICICWQLYLQLHAGVPARVPRIPPPPAGLLCANSLWVHAVSKCFIYFCSRGGNPVKSARYAPLALTSSSACSYASATARNGTHALLDAHTMHQLQLLTLCAPAQRSSVDARPDRPSETCTKCVNFNRLRSAMRHRADPGDCAAQQEGVASRWFHAVNELLKHAHNAPNLTLYMST